MFLGGKVREGHHAATAVELRAQREEWHAAGGEDDSRGRDQALEGSYSGQFTELMVLLV